MGCSKCDFFQFVEAGNLTRCVCKSRTEKGRTIITIFSRDKRLRHKKAKQLLKNYNPGFCTEVTMK